MWYLGEPLLVAFRLSGLAKEDIIEQLVLGFERASPGSDYDNYRDQEKWEALIAKAKETKTSPFVQSFITRQRGFKWESALMDR